MESEGGIEEGIAVSLKSIRAGQYAAFAAFLLVLACGDDGKKTVEPTPDPPMISSIDPVSGEVGSSVSIAGAHFGNARGTSRVEFAGTVALTTSWAETRIDATVPEGAITGSVVVTVDGMSSNGVTFTVVEPGPDLVIQRLIPTRTLVGDAVTISGSGFEAAQGGEPIVVSFAGSGSRVEAPVLAWTPLSIHVTVPEGTVDGPVRVAIGQSVSNDVGFSVAPLRISFAQDLLPLFGAKGCISCHSGEGASGNLQVDSVANLMRGDSDHGPVVIPRESGASVLVLKLLPEPPFGDRMPLGCTTSCVGEVDLLKIRDWIDQGALAE